MEPSSPARPVVLVGFMGSGKSVVGCALARALCLPFVDCDAVIAAKAGPIPAIMAEKGEAGFRTVEREVTLDALEQALREPCVIALGGGAVLDGDVREALKRLPHVAWLTAPVPVMWERVRRTGLAGRPLARDEESFARLYEQRAALYEEVSSMRVPNDGGVTAAAEVAGEIARRLGEGDGRREGTRRRGAAGASDETATGGRRHGEDEA